MAMPDLRLITAPTALPVTLAQAKAHLRVSSPSQDDLIKDLIGTAVEDLDGKDGELFRCIMPQTWVQYLDFGFPTCRYGRIDLPLGPVREIDSITYLDADGEEQTVPAEDYELCPADGLDDAYVRPVHGRTWPSCRSQERAATITYQAGYENADSVPKRVKQAMLLMIGHWYTNREAIKTGTIVATLPLAVEHLVGKLKRMSV